MDFDIDNKVAAIAFGFWLFIILMMWKFIIVPAESTQAFIIKIIVSILSLPVCYLVVKKQSGG